MRAPSALLASLTLVAVSGSISRSSLAHPHPPPPMSEAELMEKSTLVVDAVCTHIICDGLPVKDGDRIKTTYLSTLTPYKVYKGQAPEPLVIRGWWYDWSSNWYPTYQQYPIPQGWAGKLYLHDHPDGTYAEVWWNGKVEDLQKSAPEYLPPCDPSQVSDAWASPDAATPYRVEHDGGGGGAEDASSGVDGTSAGGCSAGGGEGRGGSVLCMSVVGLLVAFLLSRQRRTRRAGRMLDGGFPHDE